MTPAVRDLLASELEPSPPSLPIEYLVEQLQVHPDGSLEHFDLLCALILHEDWKFDPQRRLFIIPPDPEE